MPRTGDPRPRAPGSDATLRPRPDRHTFPTLPRRPIRIVLDGVTFLPNVGTMFRLCDAFRVEHLSICGFALEAHKRALVSAASGTIGWVPYSSHERAVDVVTQARADGYHVAAIELSDHSVPPEGIVTTRPLCLVIGAEREGVSAEVLALADQHVEIPTDGVGGSINLTTAASIVMYTASRAWPLPRWTPDAPSG